MGTVSVLHWARRAREDGELPEVEELVLRGLRHVQEAQGGAVQVGQVAPDGPGEAALRREAEGFRWSDEACLPQEGEDDEEDLAEAVVHEVQACEAVRDQALQALRAGRPGP